MARNRRSGRATSSRTNLRSRGSTQRLNQNGINQSQRSIGANGYVSGVGIGNRQLSKLYGLRKPARIGKRILSGGNLTTPKAIRSISTRDGSLQGSHAKGRKMVVGAHALQSQRSLNTNKTRDPKTCKARPNPRKAQKGTGGSRPFIPWCKKT